MIANRSFRLPRVKRMIPRKVDRELEGEGIRMGIIEFIIVGLIAGYIASRIVNKAGEGFIRDILLGVLGALVGGIIFERLGLPGSLG